MGCRYLYLVRHGQYHMDPEKPAYGTLTPLGRRQAVRTAKRLGDISFDAIHCSDVVRAVETASLIADRVGRLPLRKTRLLREGIPTLPAGEKGSASRIRETRARMDSAFDRFFKRRRGNDCHELIVAHGNLIRYLVRRSLGDHVGKWWRMGIFQCSLTVVCIADPPRHELLISFNDAGHLPRKMQTYL